MYSRSTPTYLGNRFPSSGGVVGVLEATQEITVLLVYMDYDPSSVASWPVLKTARVHPGTCNLEHLLTRHGSPTIY
jgi:hypothetical protein